MSKSFFYRNYKITSPLSNEDAKSYMDMVIDNRYNIQKSYVNTKRSKTLKIESPEKQIMILKQPGRRYKNLRNRILALIKPTEALAQHKSICLLKKLGFNGPEPILAAEKKIFCVAVDGMLLYSFIKGEKINVEDQEQIKKVACTLISIHNKGYIRNDPRPNNFLISEEGEVFFIDFKLNKPVFFKKTKIRNEFHKLMRKHPETENYLSEKERNSLGFQLTKRIKNMVIRSRNNISKYNLAIYKYYKRKC